MSHAMFNEIQKVLLVEKQKTFKSMMLNLLAAVEKENLHTVTLMCEVSHKVDGWVDTIDHRGLNPVLYTASDAFRYDTMLANIEVEVNLLRQFLDMIFEEESTGLLCLPIVLADGTVNLPVLCITYLHLGLAGSECEDTAIPINEIALSFVGLTGVVSFRDLFKKQDDPVDLLSQAVVPKHLH